ncbi:MAG: hypothetical protein U5K71_02055 [Gracilimonas sp.]|nr:hypothetical protein [Gracilimonas sp.]
MKLFKAAVLAMLLLLPSVVFSQLYVPLTVNRPGGLDWQEIRTEHFRIIFPNGEDSLAYRSAAILESHYDKTFELTGGTLKNFPVILNNYNDLSNGYVASINFRSEIELPAIRGKGMNPQSGDWLETVLPHELVHAAHFNIQMPLKGKKISIPNFVSLFSPDLARTFHGFPPYGLHEGLAVYYETESVAPMGGRGNYTFTMNRFNSNFAGPNRWNMGQTLIPSDYSQPFNRHYISGYAFVDWMQNKYGEEVSKNAIRYHYHNFFLGYGFALRMKTGEWPGELYDAYKADIATEEQIRLDNITVNTTARSEVIDTPFKGEETHAPKWINDNSFLFYGSYYNSRVGFYRYDLPTGDFKLLKETFGVSDYNYEIENGELLYSSYQRHPLFPRTYISDVNRLDLSSRKTQKITRNKRTFAPTSNGDITLALQTDGTNGRIVEVLDNGETNVIREFTDANPVSLEFNPNDPEQLAIIVNRRGVQALWVTSINALEYDLTQEPTLAFKDASIHDPEWHPTENTLMFTLDRAPAMNIYEYDLETGNITQITSSLFNAFEGSYSPDGNRIAYIVQQDSERKLAVLDRNNFYDQKLSASALLTGNDLIEELNRPLVGSEIIDEIKSIEKRSYRGNLSWLKPRAILPSYEEKSGTAQVGAVISSIDPLSSQAYSIEVSGIQNRLWYDATYMNKTFYPGFELSAYSDPNFFITRDPNTDDLFSLMRQDRGFGLTLPFNYTFRGDTRYSALTFYPGLNAEQFKYYDLSSNELSDFSTRYSAEVFTQLSLGILNLSRDIQPSSGISFFGIYEKTLNEPTAVIQFPGGPANRIFSDQWSAYYGAFGFVSPLRKWNQSLRLDLQFLQQSDAPIYSNSTIVPLGFDDEEFPNFSLSSGEGFSHIGRFSTRYTIPLFYPDNGGLTVPLYLSSIYLTAFSHTLTDMESGDLLDASRSIFGGGLHVQFKVSNVLFDFGVGLAYEPTRNRTQLIFGQF